MIRLGVRVRTLERRRVRAGACTQCAGINRLRCVFGGEPGPPPCPSCGCVGTVVRFVLAEGPRPEAGQ